MKRQNGVGTLRLIAALLLLGGVSVRGQADGTTSGEVLIRMKPGGNITTFAASYGLKVLDGIPDLLIYSLSAPVGSEATVAAKLAADSRLLWAETEDELHNPEVGGKVYHFAFDKGPNAAGYINQNAYSQIHVGNAWNYSTGRGVIVAVLDTGATYNHPALYGHYLLGYDEIHPAVHPWDIADGKTNIAVGHGTMIAGIIARIAPDAKILPVRVMNGDGIGTMMDVAKGLHYAVKAGARVVTMSFGSLRLSEAMKDVLDEAKSAGVVMVAAAGNEGTDKMQYPALRSGVLAVTSVESNNVKSSYSCYGSAIQVVSPGTGIRSTYINSGYATWSGTSFSVPFVAAQAVLIRSRYPTLDAKTVGESITLTAHTVDNVNPLYQGKLGKGLIDIEASVRLPH